MSRTTRGPRVNAGIRTAVGLAPILPGLSDRPDQLDEVIRAARDAGATSVWCNVLYLQPGTREHFLATLARDWPEQLPRYETLYRGPFLERDVSERIKARVAELRGRYEIDDRRTLRIEPPSAPLQLPLAI